MVVGGQIKGRVVGLGWVGVGWVGVEKKEKASDGEEGEKEDISHILLLPIDCRGVVVGVVVWGMHSVVKHVIVSEPKVRQ